MRIERNRAGLPVAALATLAALSVTLAAWPATADTSSAPPPEDRVEIGVQEAIDRALEASPRLDELEALRSARAAEGRRARAGRLPRIDLAGRYTRLSSVPELSIDLPDGGERTIFRDIPNDLRLRMEFGVPLYTGGRLEASVDAAEGSREAAGHDLAAARSDLVFETTAAYWDLVVKRRTRRVLEEAIAAFDAHVEDARNRRRFGLAARNEVLAVRVERDRAELDRLRAANAVAVAEAGLARLLDLEPGSRIVPTDRLEETDGETEGGTSSDPERAGIEELVGRALESRPERAALQARLEAARARVRVEEAARLPRVEASGGYEVAKPNRRILPLTETFKDTWDVSVGLVYNLFDGDETGAAVARAEAEADAVRRRVRDLERRIRLEVTARVLELETARAAVRVAERALGLARENLEVASDRYREGLIPSSELLDAENALLRAGLDRAEARREVRLARAALDRAIGKHAP